jgi:RNA polymerase sigma-70 factor, ECF subfamily
VDKSQAIEFTIAFNRHKNKIFNYVLKMVNDEMLAEDIVQDVFLKFFENLNSIKNRNSISYWLFATARNEIYSYYRRKKIRADQFNVYDPEEIEVEFNENAEEIFELKEMKELIIKELNDISVEQREPFIMKEFGGLSYKEIASIMNIDEKTVKSRLYKTRQKLIQKISKIVK